MPASLQPEEFLAIARALTVVDVRAPAEFSRGHIPRAVNLPLFDDAQRKMIGTVYRTNGQQAAILKGLEIVGPRMRQLAEQALKVASALDPDNPADPPQILLHCARGGMRSQAMSWLYAQVALDAFVLEGGYKAYRRHVHQAFKQPLKLVVLSGLTGAGKTRQMANLKACGEQVVDLEDLAHHRGSAFGGIGRRQQPTVEQFENNIHEVLRHLDRERRVWFEDESRKIGSVILPQDLFAQIKAAPAIFMDVPSQIRSQQIIYEYGQLPNDDIVLAIDRIKDRLGGQNAWAAIKAIQNGDLATCVDTLLAYYDRSYLNAKSKHTRNILLNVKVEDPASQETTKLLLDAADTLHQATHVG